jgi:hypothetical protein
MLTNMSVRGDRYIAIGEETDTEQVFLAIITPHYTTNEGSTAFTHCDLVILRSEADRLTDRLHPGTWLRSDVDENYERYSFTLGRHATTEVLEYLMIIFREVARPSPHFWFTFGGSRVADADIQIIAVEGSRTDIEVRQNLQVEESQAPVTPYSLEVWQGFIDAMQASGMLAPTDESNLADGATQLLPGDSDDESYYVELSLRPDAVPRTVSLEYLMFTIAQSFPPVPPRHKPFKPGRGR